MNIWNSPQTICLGTSKLNYLDPRITVQWCKTHKVPIEKVWTFLLNYSIISQYIYLTYICRCTPGPTERSSAGRSTWSWMTMKFSTFRSCICLQSLRLFFPNIQMQVLSSWSRMISSWSRKYSESIWEQFLRLNQSTFFLLEMEMKWNITKHHKATFRFVC